MIDNQTTALTKKNAELPPMSYRWIIWFILLSCVGAGVGFMGIYVLSARGIIG
jgi:hypothetical protein